MEFNTIEVLEGEVTIIEAPARLDAVVAADFRAKMGELVDDKRYNLIIDLGQTEFVDSSGLGAIVSKIAMTRSNNGDIRLAAPSARILELLEITHLNKVFKSFDDVTSAIESYR